MTVGKGDTVTVEYEGSLDNGIVFDSTSGREPLKFKVGENQVIPGFEAAIIGMDVDQEKTFRLEASDAYGDRNPDLLRDVPKQQLPPEVTEGMTVIAELENGHQVPVKIEKVGKESATIDLNHPLAGKDLNFKVKVVSSKK